MIELIERTLLNGGDLESARQTLLNQANTDRLNRNNQIEHDFKVAYLIRECIMTEPKGSSGYAVSKGILNRLKEQYRDRESEKLVRKLMKAEKVDERKEQSSNDRFKDEERQTDLAGTEQAVI